MRRGEAGEGGEGVPGDRFDRLAEGSRRLSPLRRTQTRSSEEELEDLADPVARSAVLGGTPFTGAPDPAILARPTERRQCEAH